MTRADDVIDNIDHALHDWGTSPDAMRWTPERAPDVATPDFSAMVASWVRAQRQVNDAFTKFALRVSGLLPRIAALAAEIRDLQEAEAQVRRSALHSAYHHRQKRRRRS